MVSIDYDLVVYKIIGVTRDFFEFLHEEHDGLKDSWNMVCEWLHEFDIRCDSIIVLWWKILLDLELVLLHLGLTRIFHEIVKFKDRES